MHLGDARSKHLFQPIRIEVHKPSLASPLDRRDGTEWKTEKLAGPDSTVERSQVHGTATKAIDRGSGPGIEPGFGERGLPPPQHAFRVSRASFNVGAGEGAHRQPSTDLPLVSGRKEPQASRQMERPFVERHELALGPEEETEEVVERTVEQVMARDHIRAMDPVERHFPVPVRLDRVFVEGPWLQLRAHLFPQEGGEPTSGVVQYAGEGSIPNLQRRPGLVALSCNRGVIEVDGPRESYNTRAKDRSQIFRGDQASSRSRAIEA